MERCIHIFPKFENMAWIDDLRKKHDSLYKLVAPHITLVFPFESEINKKVLRKHIQTVVEVKPFTLTMDRLYVEDKYLFLLPAEGHDEIIDLNLSLYTGILEKMKGSQNFLPHLTLGRFSSETKAEEFKKTLKLEKPFTCLVDTIAVEIIEDDGKSTIEYVHRL